jgi:hypothetical protein
LYIIEGKLPGFDFGALHTLAETGSAVAVSMKNLVTVEEVKGVWKEVISA